MELHTVIRNITLVSGNFTFTTQNKFILFIVEMLVNAIFVCHDKNI